MTKLIPSIYFYVVSLIGLVLLIIGVFADIHYVANISSGSVYPLPYATDSRCALPAAPPVPSMTPEKQSENAQATYNACLQNIEDDRKLTKRNDLEKAVSYTLIGLIVFSIHFYFARKQKVTS